MLSINKSSYHVINLTFNILNQLTVLIFVLFVFGSVLPLSQSEVKSPVLLLWGERDAFLEQDMAEACRLYIRNHFRLNIISGASHWLQQDQPDIVNTLIWTFIKEGEGRKNYRNL